VRGRRGKRSDLQRIGSRNLEESRSRVHTLSVVGIELTFNG
jgi:hypothetical protein